MLLAQNVSSLVLSLRKKVNIKVRQPLERVLIPVLNPTMKDQIEKIEELVKAEVNVKKVEYITGTEGIINKKVKPNFKLLGSRLGSKMKAATAKISQLNQDEITWLEKDGKVEVDINGEQIQISLDEVEIVAEEIPGWSIASRGNLTVALDVRLTDALKKEGDAREFINRIQSIRKEKGFELTDRIFVTLADNNEIKGSLNEFKKYICAEILADNIEFVPDLQDGTPIEVNNNLLTVSVNKKG
jgi:isoleucyl-tRNA synthetase